MLIQVGKLYEIFCSYMCLIVFFSELLEHTINKFCFLYLLERITQRFPLLFSFAERI